MVDLAIDMKSPSRQEARQGAMVKEIVPQSPAMDAGLKPGDIIVDINDSSINSVKDALQAVGASGPTMMIHVVRNGTELELKAVVSD
jgi:S1-C subfamily serine protease